MLISLLSIGDEITDGFVINTNTSIIAKILHKYGFNIINHIICNDHYSNIEKSFNFLYKDNDIIIITGGLGPTEDDITILSLAKILNRNIVFNNDSWKRIVKILNNTNTKINLSFNKKQAYIIDNSICLINKYGTADGCYIQNQEKHIFIFPGPPFECINMFKSCFDNHFKNFVLKIKTSKIYRWLLINISEAEISEKIKYLFKNKNIKFQYRLNYPYVELYTKNKCFNLIKTIKNRIDKNFSFYIVSNNYINNLKKTNIVLKDYIEDNNIKIVIQQDITQGYLMSKFYYDYSKFYNIKNEKNKICQTINIRILESEKFLTIKINEIDTVKIEFYIKKTNTTIVDNIKFKNYGFKSFRYLYDLLCFKIINLIKKEIKNV